MIKRFVLDTLERLGYDLVKHVPPQEIMPEDFEQYKVEIIKSVRPYTMTSFERLEALISATNYLIQADIPGAFVECGVWRGGSMMAVAYTLLRASCTDKLLYLFDTYEGMTKPGADDVSSLGEEGLTLFAQTNTGEDSSNWCLATLDEVRTNLASTKYPNNKVVFVKGKVEATIPSNAPDRIALLRLDTDWYDSTAHEMEHLFPRLSRGGVVIFDDYGYWHGHRKAIDEYFARHEVHMMLNRVDGSARIGIKL